MSPTNPGIRIHTTDGRYVRAARKLGFGFPTVYGMELTLAEIFLCEQYAYGLELLHRAAVQKEKSLGLDEDSKLRSIGLQGFAVVLEKLGLETIRDAEQKAHNLVHRATPPPQPPGPPRMPPQKPPDDVLQQLLVSSKFHFNAHILNVFERLNLKTIGDLIQKNPEDLLRCKNFGRKRLQEVEAMLQAYGLQLGIKKTVSLPANNILPFRRKDRR